MDHYAAFEMLRQAKHEESDRYWNDFLGTPPVTPSVRSVQLSQDCNKDSRSNILLMGNSNVEGENLCSKFVNLNSCLFSAPTPSRVAYGHSLEEVVQEECGWTVFLFC